MVSITRRGLGRDQTGRRGVPQMAVISITQHHPASIPTPARYLCSPRVSSCRILALPLAPRDGITVLVLFRFLGVGPRDAPYRWSAAATDGDMRRRSQAGSRRGVDSAGFLIARPVRRLRPEQASIAVEVPDLGPIGTSDGRTF